MKLDKESINSNLTQDELDSLVNSLLVSFKEFSITSGLYGRAYGVLSACDLHNTVINACGRRLIFKHLIEAHAAAERELLYDVTPRYHLEKVKYETTNIIQLKRPGFAGFYQQTISDSVMGTQTVNPFLIQDVPLIDSGAGYTIAQLDEALVYNPLKVVLIDSSTGHQFHPQDIYGFPRQTGGNWEIALGNDLLPADILSKTVHAFHCEMIYVDIPDETLVTGQTLYPVYPGSNQIIPYARDPEPLSPSGTRLWFYSHSLVDNVFGVDGVDLRGGKLEFYKLLSAIDIKIFEEVEVLPSLEYEISPVCDTGGIETTNETPTFTSVPVEGFKARDSGHSIIELYPDHSTARLNKAGTPKEYTIYYKTDPAVLGFEGDATEIKEGISHKAAAEMPLKMCGCTMDTDGFVQICQQSYDQIRVSLTGERVQNLTHGNLYGQAVFREKMKSVYTYYKVVRI